VRWMAALALLAVPLSGCGGPVEPAPIDSRHDACAWCRMGVSDPRLAAQLVAPLEEPRLFDDIGCLRDYLASGASLPPGAAAFVADHRTGRFVLAARAVYARSPALATPMASGIAAWEDASSRAADRSVAGGAEATAADIFGTTVPPEGEP
jgi:copper chaperone NosL